MFSFTDEQSVFLVMICLRKYPYFEVLVGFAWSHTSEIYAGGSVAAGRASHARQVKGDDPDKKGHAGLPRCVLGVELQPHSIESMFCWEVSKIEEDSMVHQGL
jgi:hypothetical protein